MGKQKRPCKHTAIKGAHMHKTAKAARACARAAKNRKGGRPWTDKELGV